MPTYVMLTTVGPDGWARIREQPERINEVTSEVEAMGLTVVAQYALLGQWDFLNVIEAPDEATMARAAVALAARGHDAHDDAAGGQRGRADRDVARLNRRSLRSTTWCGPSSPSGSRRIRTRWAARCRRSGGG